MARSSKSREKGISFTYERGGKILHCGVKTTEEYERWNNCLNPLAPSNTDVVNNVYLLKKRRTDLDGITSGELKKRIGNPFENTAKKKEE